MDKESLILELYDVGAIKFGEYKLKNGLSSPIYLELKLIMSYPKLLRQMSSLLWNLVQSTSFELVSGLAPATVPLATCLSIEHAIPMITYCKTSSHCPGKSMIEGAHKVGQQCLVIKDIMTSGNTILETMETFQKARLEIKDIVVVVDRQQGGHIRLIQKGYHVHVLFTVTEILDTLNQYKKINENVHLKPDLTLRARLH